MGAVQSGKTASMLAVTAKALDRGVDAVVLLAGTRTALWLQTWERFVAELDTAPHRTSTRLMLPAHAPSDVADGALSISALYAITDQLAARAIARRRPIVVVALKQVDHLQRLAETLQEVVYPLVASAGRPFHLLVLDDEADDSSIDETDLNDHASLQERQVPRRIVDLWELRQRPGETAVPELQATYVGYTATPQANFLQDDSNPLAPRDFVVSLRTPGAEGNARERDVSYRVPEGLPGWYTGGDVYYRILDSVPLCVPIDELSEHDRLVDGVRAFLVASAIRCCRSMSDRQLHLAVDEEFSTAAEALDACGPVMSMLVHPSASKDAQFQTAGRLLAWSAGLDESEASRLLGYGARGLHTAGIAADMDDNPDSWLAWLHDYKRSNLVISRLPGPSPVGPEQDWEKVRRVILELIAPATSVAVINSDERADDRPSYKPVQTEHGWRAAPNLRTIFVSGNVMSRGLTLEGLSTTVFTRSSDDPAADTQMQMQRWFGYRGSYIDVCRVMMTSSQIALFRQYHETDLALRRQVLGAMSSESPASPAVLQGRAFKATGKIRNLRSRQLWPGPEPFLTYLNSSDADRSNQEVVARLFRGDSVGVPDDRARQGRMLARTLNMGETAALLDSLRFPAEENGGIDPRAAARWTSVQTLAGVAENDPRYPIFRMPRDTDPGSWGNENPSNVAAYLRFWEMCLDERLPATFTTDEPPLLWSLVDLDERISSQPRFRVAIRFGPGEALSSGPLSALAFAVRPMKREVEGVRLKATWGSRNYRNGVLWGDEYFDCYRSGVLPRQTESRARARGSDGLLLFHVVEHGSGVAIAPALSIPVGGPDLVQALTRGTDAS